MFFLFSSCSFAQGSVIENFKRDVLQVDTSIRYEVTSVHQGANQAAIEYVARIPSDASNPVALELTATAHYRFVGGDWVLSEVESGPNGLTWNL